MTIGNFFGNGGLTRGNAEIVPGRDPNGNLTYRKIHRARAVVPMWQDPWVRSFLFWVVPGIAACLGISEACRILNGESNQYISSIIPSGTEFEH